MIKSAPNDRPAPSGARSVGATVADSPEGGAPAKSSRRNTLAWGVLGFLMGAVFWHVVGFWDFLGGVVYKRQQDATVIERVLTMTFAEAEEDRPLAERERQARMAAQNCTTLVLDRVSGTTVSRPCVVIIRNVPEDIGGTQPARTLSPSARLDRIAGGR
jgi:hypothetical protein